MRAILLLGLLVTLAACETGDPRQGGFIGGVGGLLSGSYDARLDQRQAAYEEALAEQRREARSREEIDRLTAAREAEAGRLRADIRRLDADATALRRDLDAIRTDTAAAADRHSELSGELDRLDREIAALEAGGGEAAARRRDELREEIDVLRREIDILDDF